MTSAIWPLEKLDRLLEHPEAPVRRWAAAKLFLLYPDEARGRLPRLLTDHRSDIVLAALDHVGKGPAEDLTGILADLYLKGEGPVSARAMHVLGDLAVESAVDRMKERILAERPLGSEQIISMIYALGAIRSPEAYELLKQTEKSVQEKDSRYWEFFYASLLRHRKVQDVATLLTIATGQDRSEELRRQALGLLLGLMDPELNPSNVFFMNHLAVGKHWGEKLAKLRSLKPPEGVEDAIREIEGLASSLTPERSLESIETLKSLWEKAGGGRSFEQEVWRLGLGLLEKGTGASETRFGLLTLTISAMLAALESKISPPPLAEVHWREHLDYLLRNRPPRPEDEGSIARVIQGAGSEDLVPLLTGVLRGSPGEWGALRAVEVLGELRAEHGCEAMLEALRTAKDALFREAVERAVLRMGIAAVPRLIPFLNDSDREVRLLAHRAVGRLPTREGVQELALRVPSFYAEDADSALATMSESGAEDFLPFLEAEYRTGEWKVGEAYVHICRVNGLAPACLREMEREVARAKELADEHRRLLAGDASRWPSAIPLELECMECGKRYHYEIHEVHLHPHDRPETSGKGPDLIPYRNGVVFGEDLRCKNCRALNRFLLTDRTLAQLTGESVKILALRKAGLKVPDDYPVKHVQMGERDGKPLTLVAAQLEHTEAVNRDPTKPGPHLAMGKLYEYVKDYAEAKRSYLKALDMDSLALEAMAGLSRIARAEGDLGKANEWIQDCYRNLEKGRLILVDDAAGFKKAVRDKRQELARELGVKPEEKPVEIRFSVDVPEHPKNKPCPCGSGKKYKLCCMNRAG